MDDKLHELLHWVKSQFTQYWSPSKDMYQLFLTLWFWTASIIITLKLVGIKGVVVIYFWAFSGIALIFTLLTLLRIRMQPKDSRLNTLITNVTTLATKVDKLTSKIDNLLDKDTAQKPITAIRELTEELKKETERGRR
jgi:peptidoglycan hydrolase CwlO-like protein